MQNKMFNILFGLFIALLVLKAENILAADYYISPAGSDLTGNGSISNPWFSPDFALNKYSNDGVDSRVGPGDTLYMRGGVYDVTAMTLNDGITNRIQTNTSPITDFITIKSFPGEWAILDGGNAMDNNSGRRIFGTNNTNYNIIFEDFEMRNAHTAAINRYEMGNNDPDFVGSIFRNLYIHGCKDTDVNANPAGMRLAIQSSIVENCTFYDNGTTGSAHYNNANLILYNSYSDVETEVQARRNNIIRYNIFDTSGSNMKDKGDSNFGENPEWANEIHHNIFINARGDAYSSVEDYVKFHHNLVINNGGGIELMATPEDYKSCQNAEVFNNTFINNSNFDIAIGAEPSNDALNHLIKNNLFYSSGANSLLFWDGSSFNHTVVSDYNFWDNSILTIGKRGVTSSVDILTWQSYGYDTNSSIGEVSFIEMQNNDYRLRNDSIGKDSGDDGLDAGAFETNWYSLAGCSFAEADLIAPQSPINLQVL